MTTANLPHATDWRAKTGAFYFVDVGSRGGFHDMSSLHPLIHMYSFDADSTTKQPVQQFASYHHFPFALSSSDGETELLLTSHPSMSSLLEFDEAVFMRHFGLVPGSETWKQMLALKLRQKTTTHKADDVFQRQELHRIDFLKLDTQGTELEILKGARQYLRAGKISVIKVEVGFIPVYRNQCEFSEVDLFLKEHGFIFVDCMFYPDAVYESRLASAVQGVRLKEQPRFSAVGDAVYVLDPRVSAEPDETSSTIRSAIVLNQLGYVSFAFDLLKGCGYETEAASELLQATAMSARFRTKAKRLLKANLPPWAYRQARRLYASLFSGR